MSTTHPDGLREQIQGSGNMELGKRREIPYDAGQKIPVWNSSPDRTQTSLIISHLLHLIAFPGKAQGVWAGLKEPVKLRGTGREEARFGRQR